ncbi:hypothetical protein SAMN05660976_02312 [Nonomuraea pusilla]|uniref:Uncharacterized protein n=1 Tax=Nonomuraea pusilla TaxID=46177 RepID=A0A1H7PBB1_9ACTN|nr:hypothetical protein SAMN05660976_02312 [Nonomuraea pusilla]
MTRWRQSRPRAGDAYRPNAPHAGSVGEVVKPIPADLAAGSAEAKAMPKSIADMSRWESPAPAGNDASRRPVNDARKRVGGRLGSA